MGLIAPPSGSTWYTSTATNSGYSGSTSNPVPYKWVRINLKIDRSASTAGTSYYVDGNSSNASKQVCYDSANLHEVVISAASCSTANSNYQPVYVLTSYAVTPKGTRRMLQQEVSTLPLNLTLPAALTIDGPVGAARPRCVRAAPRVITTGPSSMGARLRARTPTLRPALPEPASPRLPPYPARENPPRSPYRPPGIARARAARTTPPRSCPRTCPFAPRH